MSETATNDTAETQEQPQGGAEGQESQAETFDADYVAKLRKEAAKYRTEAKANADAATRLAEIEDAQKTVEQRAAERESAAEKRIAEAEARAERRDVAIEHRLSTEDAALLDDLTDPDAIRRLAARLAAAAEAEAGPRAPRPNPAQRSGDSITEDKDATARAFFGI